MTGQAVVVVQQTGEGLGPHGIVLLLVAIVVLIVRPTGGGQLLSLWRAVRGREGALNLSLGVLGMEVVALVAVGTGLGATLLYGRVFAACGAFCEPGPVPPVTTTDALGGDPLVVGTISTAVLLFGLALWGAAWVAEGFSSTSSRPWRE